MAEEFPYKIVTLPDEENEQIKRDFKAYISGAVKVEPLGYFFQGIYQDYAHRYYTLPVRSTDVFVASYPKCGTTWTQEMVWLLVHNLDYEGAKCRLDKRFPFTEEDSVIDSRIFKLPGIMKLDVQPPEPGKSLDMVRTLPDPRCLKTHMPFSLLTPGILDTCKMIYVARDPRDVVVSYYHHHRMWAPHCYNGDFKKFFNYFLSDQVMWSPFWSHVREAWERKDHHNLLIITYEELKADLSAVTLKVASFLEKKVSPTDLTKLVKHLRFDSMKKNPSVNAEVHATTGFCDAREGGFIRKGKSGGWREYFDEPMKEEFEKWMREKGKGLEKEFKWLP